MTRLRATAASAIVLLIGLSWALTLPPAAADAGTLFSVDEPSVAEGDAGTTNLVFTITLSGTPITSNASVDFFTNNAGTAHPPGDYGITSTTLTFTPGGPTTQQVVVPVVGDLRFEADETVPVTLDDPVNGAVSGFGKEGTILNDDPVPSISVGDGIASEQGVAVLPITLSNLSQADVTVDYTAVAGSAGEGTDFVAETGTITFQATFATQIVIDLVHDLVEEPTESFTVVLSNPVGGTIADGTGVATILDDDAPQGPPGEPDDGPEGGGLGEGPGKGIPGLGLPVPEVDVPPTTTSTTATTAPVAVPAGGPTTSSPSTSTPTTAGPAATVAARSTGAQALPRTGSSTRDLAAVGAAAVLLGVLAVRRAARSRRF